MSELENRFLEEVLLVADGMKRVRFGELCIAFGKVYPALTGLEQRRRLCELLTALQALGELRFPSGKQHFDRAAEPTVPRWIQLTTSVSITRDRRAFEAATFPWSPELRFAANIKNVQQLDALERIHDFLASGGASRCFVPIKERSVELFGDEKKLDALRKGGLFRTGMLSLELLRCFQVTPPLVWERGPQWSESPVLVVENHSTYDSFLRWNRGAGAWAAVCYGNGDSFEVSAPSLDKIIRELLWDGTLHYFGDLDPKGLMIPLRASRALVENGLPAMKPQAGCYHRLLDRADEFELPMVGNLVLSRECAGWLGVENAQRVEEWFARGMRIPQELVGYEQLALGGEEIIRSPWG